MLDLVLKTIWIQEFYAKLIRALDLLQKFTFFSS